MELRHIRYFLAVAEEQNFTRAAKRVGIGQPPLSQQIRALEDEIGTPLFHRLTHGAELTSAGKVFLLEARAIMQQADRAKRMALLGAKGQVGQVRIGFTSSAVFRPIVPAILRTFRQNHPKVELFLTEKDTTQLLNLLSENRLDASFIRPGRRNPEQVNVHRFKDESSMAVLSSAHPLAKKRAIRLSALSNEPFVIFPRTAGANLFDEIIDACRRSGFDPMIAHEAPQISSAPNLVSAGLGVSIVPVSIAAQIQVKGVVYLPILGEPPAFGLALATRLNEKSTVVRNFQRLAAACPEV
ncbi:MAG TPA: LysR family transcriptional regulator [Chthoniobacterales bacterium]|jgi:DNA-binding transcriptional LysR family regulator|nr:LysR family transcriptional regulator [Chthoniobacterales bacterium]